MRRAGRRDAAGISSSDALHTWGVAMRLTDFWARMDRQFGAGYAESVARDQVLASLGGATIEGALARGDDAQDVWRAVCREFDVPAREH
jgi:hypothetical protein